MSNIDFGELKNDTNFTTIVNNFSKSLDEIDATITEAVNYKDYDELTTEEKVKFDNYLAYTTNSLYWMYVRLNGLDPNTHGIKNELSRVRQAMLRDKQIYERNTIRPVLDKSAAGRFIRHGLHDRSNREDEEDGGEEVQEEKKPAKPLNKKIIFDDNSD
ncbi:nuclear nucleic acid-binding protein C1D [Episyrphus balteatus]|uniref:nuclear nucleic acid-binding protein C1D n=1 Tax=Episyrphus balteatus TaxID=286459 RepID=UPI002485B980|nr:nuclear nucleic acid-binding protein C1D [Episyrphus balteatus]